MLWGGLEGEDHRSDLADDAVELGDGRVDDLAGVTRHERLHRLQLEADGEEALDDRVVEVAGDAFSVGHHGEVADLLEQPAVLDGTHGGRCQGFEDAFVVVGERSVELLCGEQRTAHGSVVEEWDDDEGASRQVPRGGTDVRALGAHVIEAERPRIAQDRLEEAGAPPVPAGGIGSLRVGPYRLDDVDGLPARVHDPCRSVLGSGERPGAFGHPSEDGGDLDGAVDAHHDAEEGPELGGVGHRAVRHEGIFPCRHRRVVPWCPPERRRTLAMSIRVFLLDDHQVVREGLRKLLEAEDDIEVVGDSGSAVDAPAVAQLVRPDVAVLDVRLPDGDGVQVCREIRAAQPDVACLMLSSFADEEALAQAVLAGASGYLLKQIHGNELVSSIRAVANGRSLIDTTTARRVVDRIRRDQAHADDVDQLTDREREILALIADGKTNRQIGAELFLSEKTVKNYVSNLLAKLGMSRRSQAAALAARIAEHKADPGAWGS